MPITQKTAKEYAQRRAAKRCAMVASAEVTDLDTNTRLSARTSEVGIGGCCVDAMNPFPVGTVVRVTRLRDRGAFDAQGKVGYCGSTMGMGVAFTEIAPDQKLVLEDWLAEIVKPAS